MTQAQDEAAPEGAAPEGMAQGEIRRRGAGEMSASAPPPDAKSMLVALREVVRRAWRTLATLRDPDLHFFRRRGWLFDVIHDVSQAYGYSSPRTRGFRPTSQDVSRMEIVMHWMAWLRRSEGELALKRIIGWSMGVPSWQMARREGCSERTIANRIDRSLNAVLKAFGDIDAEPALVEEVPQPVERLRAHRDERPTAMQAGMLRPGKLWIDGVGWMFEGRPWDDGSHRVDKLERPRRASAR